MERAKDRRRESRSLEISKKSLRNQPKGAALGGSIKEWGDWEKGRVWFVVRQSKWRGERSIMRFKVEAMG